MTARKTGLARDARVRVTIDLPAPEAEALASAVFTCTSTSGWREAQHALAAVQQAMAARLETGR